MLGGPLRGCLSLALLFSFGARTADESFTEYLAGNGTDSREAGNEADIAMDRAAERCLQLGATNSFPTQP